MLERIKNEPVMLVVSLLAILNIALGSDPDVTANLIESLVLVASGVGVRQVVTPTRKVKANSINSRIKDL